MAIFTALYLAPCPRPRPIISPEAPGDVQRLAGDPGRICGGQDHGRGTDVPRLTDPPERRLGFDLLAEIAFRDSGRMEPLGLDHARVDRVHADLPWSQLLGERLRYGV